MKIKYEIDIDEEVTPVGVAEALINGGVLTTTGLEELSGHLNAYTRRVQKEYFEERRR